MRDSLVILLELVAWGGATYCLGTLLLRRFRITPESRELKLGLGIVLGLGGWTLVIFFLGMVGGIYPWIVRAVSLVVVVGWLASRKPEPGGVPFLCAARFRECRVNWRILLGGFVLAAAIANACLCALAPPAGDCSDDTYEHRFPQCRHWSLTHDLRIIPDNIYCNVQNIESLFLFYCQVFSFDNAKSLQLLFLFSLGCGILHLLRTSGLSWLYAGFGLLVFLVTPLAHFHPRGGYIELGTANFIFWSVLMWLRYLERGEKAGLLLSAVFSGLACGSKFYGIFHLLIMLVLQAGWCLGPAPAGVRRTRCRDLACYLGMALVVGSPWYLRSWMLLGTPLYPPTALVYRIFGGRYFTPELARSLSFDGRGDPKGWWDFLALPWRMTVYPGRYRFWGGITTLYLSLAPLALFFGARRRMIVIYLYTGLFLLALFKTNTFVHYGTAPLALLLLPVTSAARGLWESGKSWIRAFLALLVATNVVLAVFIILKPSRDSYRVSLGWESRPAYVARKTPFYDAYQYINREIPREATVFLTSFWLSPFFVERLTMKSGGVYLHVYSPYQADYVLDVNTGRKPPAEKEDSGNWVYRYPQGDPSWDLIKQGENWRLYRVRKSLSQ